MISLVRGTRHLNCIATADVSASRRVSQSMSFSSSSLFGSTKEESINAPVTLPKVVETTLFDEIMPTVLPLNGKDTDVTIVLGVSGGCDSVALLHALKDIRLNRRGGASYSIHVVHFDHQQRGADSDGDRHFVSELCDELELPFHCFFWNNCGSIGFSQDTARQWRRQTMRGLLISELKQRTKSLLCRIEGEPSQVGLLMTAHHRDDSDETLMLKLLRGVHVTNISGLSVVKRDDDPAIDYKVPIFWARPLINLRKTEIVDFLKARDLNWREDASNMSNKYLRNRVRNELIPLLKDMVGADSLERRLQRLEVQTSELRRDLDDRTRSYLIENVKDGTFLLPADSSRFDLTARDALYMWVLQQSDGYHFSFERAQRVCKQIQNYPDQRVWRLDIGNNWNVARQGDALRLARDGESAPRKVPSFGDEVEWFHVADIPRSYDVRSTIIINMWMDTKLQPLRFLRSTLGDTMLYILPPWRKRGNPIKVSEFLRGQGVPLHLRREASVITCQFDDGTEALVAVCVSAKDKWVVNAAFAVDDCDATFDSEQINRLAISVKRQPSD